MAECKDCIHFCVCSPYTAPNESYPEVDGCKYFRATADVVPKSEVEELQAKVARLRKENTELLVSKETDIHISMEKLVKVRTEHPIFKAIEEKVAREIFEEIEKITMHNVTSSYGIWLMSMGEDAFAELKKKYIGESDVKRDTV
ncbi:MAG: hypothetical protein U0M60_23635 [Clostridia bacterium]|nr:hypothetical protein [Clostridia bacterium]